MIVPDIQEDWLSERVGQEGTGLLQALYRLDLGRKNLTCIWAISPSAVITLRRGRAWSKIKPTAGAAKSIVILVPTPKEYAMFPAVHMRFW